MAADGGERRREKVASRVLGGGDGEPKREEEWVIR
jgi:hypothetical protein